MWRVAAEFCAIALGPYFALVALGRSAWTPPNTPDSEFYLSLAVFGEEVTSRAPEPAYYWTRLGVIAPLNVLSGLFGPEAAYAIWRWVLLALATVPLYYLLRRLSGRPAGVAGVGVVALNTLFLTVAGNPYPTGTVVALLVGSLSLLALALLSPRGGMLALGAAAGVCVGWLVMCNQIAGVYAILSLLPLAIALVWRRRTWAVASLALAVVAAIASFGLLLSAGGRIFVGLDWWQTTRRWSEILDPSAFHSPIGAWITSATALLVPLVVLGTGVIAVVRAKDMRWVMGPAIAALALCLAFASWNQFVLSGALLQTYVYVAFLWAPTLVVLALVLATMIPRSGAAGWTLSGLVVASSYVAARVITGSALIIPDALAIALVGLGAVCIGFFGLRGTPRVISLALGVVVLAVVPQSLQNLQPTSGSPFGPRIPLSSAFAAGDVGSGYLLALEVEEWVIEHSHQSTVMVWSPEPALAGIAAMSLNGPNALSEDWLLSPAQAERLRVVSPTSVLLLARDASGIGAQVKALQDTAQIVGAARCRRWVASVAGHFRACLVRVTSGRSST